jgi:CBS domain-containing protein
MSVAHSPSTHRYIGPPLSEARVRDVMRLGVVTCRPETPLRDVAAMMSGYGVHSVVVDRGDEGIGVVSDLDLAAAIIDLPEATAGDTAGTELVTVTADDTLELAARRMRTHDVHHLLVVDPETGAPVGVVAASGIAWAASYAER